MGWFSKRKEVKVVTENVLCIHLTEDKIKALASKVIYALIDKNNAVFQKKKEKTEKEYDIVYDIFSKEVEKQFPWIENWRLIKRVQMSEDNFYLEVLKMDTEININL